VDDFSDLKDGVGGPRLEGRGRVIVHDLRTAP
jgi:hypothetical protein